MHYNIIRRELLKLSSNLNNYVIRHKCAAEVFLTGDKVNFLDQFSHYTSLTPPEPSGLIKLPFTDQCTV